MQQNSLKLTNQESKSALLLVSRYTREVIDPLLKTKINPDLLTNSNLAHEQLTKQVPDIFEQVKKFAHLNPENYLQSNVMQRAKQILAYNQSPQEYTNYLFESYDQICENIFQITPQMIILLIQADDLLGSEIQIRDEDNPIDLDQEKIFSLLIEFAQSIAHQLGSTLPETFHNVQIQRVNWTVGMYRESENNIYINEQKKVGSVGFLNTLAHEFGHHVHYSLAKSLNIPASHTPYIDFASPTSEGFAIYFVESFCEFLMEKGHFISSQKLRENNDRYIQFTIRRGRLAHDLCSPNSPHHKSQKRYLEHIKVLSRFPQVEYYNSLANPGYKESYYLGYHYAKKIGLLNLAKKGLVSLSSLQ